MIRALIRARRTFMVAAALSALALGLPACDSGPKKVKIAVCGPMTGSAAAFGEMIKNAAKLYEKEVNDAGGLDIGGKKMLVEAKIFDDKGDTTEAANVARKVTSDNDIVLVIGHFNSTCSIAAKEEYNHVGIVEFSPGSTNVNVCKGGPYTFRNLYRDDFQGHQIAEYMKNYMEVSSVGVIFDNDDYGKGLMQAFKAKAEELGLEVVATVPYLRERTQDYKPLVQQVKDAGAGSIFIAGLYNDAALITKAARQDLRMDVPLVGGDGVMSPTYIANAGASAEGAFVMTPFLVHKSDARPQAKAFIEAFVAAYGKDPDTWAALTYDAIGMAGDAIRKVGLDRKAIRDHLASVQDEAAGYTGVTGVTFFDAEGDCYSKPVYVAMVKDGAFVPAPQQLADR